MSWVVASPNAIPTGAPGAGQSVSDTIFIDSILTNGGKLSENKNFDFKSKNPSEGLFNIENQKVLTYTSTEGSHMVGEEEYTLSVAGNYSTSDGNIRCVFSQNTGFIIPAFCNIVSAKSALTNINTAQISSMGQIRAVAETIDVPTALNYHLAVSPDQNSGSHFAEGGVKTVFAGSSMEARDGGDSNYQGSGSGSDGTTGTWNKTSLVRTWKDSTSVVGQIRHLQKNFDDPSELGSMFTPPQGHPTPVPTITPTQTATICSTGSVTIRLEGPDCVNVYLTNIETGSATDSWSVCVGAPHTWANLAAGQYMEHNTWHSHNIGTLHCGGTLEYTVLP
jgi:hypothetical protein